MSGARERAIEAGANALLGTDNPCKRFGDVCVAHKSTLFVDEWAPFANQSERECSAVHWARGRAAAVLAATEPIIRADEQRRGDEAVEALGLAQADAARAEDRLSDLRAKVEGLRTRGTGARMIDGELTTFALIERNEVFALFDEEAKP
jgi:hypothetical protein